MNTVSEFYQELNPSTLSGAIDIVVVEHEWQTLVNDFRSESSHPPYNTSTIKLNPSRMTHKPDRQRLIRRRELVCSPFHVRFGKRHLLMRAQNRRVQIRVNGNLIPDLEMRLSETGEAYFLKQVSGPMRSPDHQKSDHNSHKIERLTKRKLSSDTLLAEIMADFDLIDAVQISECSASKLEEFEQKIVWDGMDTLSVGQTSKKASNSSFEHLSKVLAKLDSVSDDLVFGFFCKQVVQKQSEKLPLNDQNNIHTNQPFYFSRKQVLTVMFEKLLLGNDFRAETASLNNNTEDNVQSGTDNSSSDAVLESSFDGNNSLGTYNESANTQDSKDSSRRNQTFYKSLRPNSDQLKRLNLMYGANSISFTVIDESKEDEKDVQISSTLNHQNYPKKTPTDVNNISSSDSEVPSAAAVDVSLKQKTSLIDSERVNSSDSNVQDLLMDSSDPSLGLKQEFTGKTEEAVPKTANDDSQSSAPAPPSLSSSISKSADSSEVNTIKSSDNDTSAVNSSVKSKQETSNQSAKVSIGRKVSQKNSSSAKSPNDEITCHARIFLWRRDECRIVVSDIDGTITKSDALGHLFSMVGRDWTHPGIANLYTQIHKNGYKLLYLTSRAIGQADSTRSYLQAVKQPTGASVLVGPSLPSTPASSSSSSNMAAHLQLSGENSTKPLSFKLNDPLNSSSGSKTETQPSSNKLGGNGAGASSNTDQSLGEKSNSASNGSQNVADTIAPNDKNTGSSSESSAQSSKSLRSEEKAQKQPSRSVHLDYEQRSIQNFSTSSNSPASSRVSPQTPMILSSVYHSLPDGPVIMSPDRLMAALKREVIDRRPEQFKIACLRDIRSLFDLSEVIFMDKFTLPDAEELQQCLEDDEISSEYESTGNVHSGQNKHFRTIGSSNVLTDSCKFWFSPDLIVSDVQCMQNVRLNAIRKKPNDLSANSDNLNQSSESRSSDETSVQKSSNLRYLKYQSKLINPNDLNSESKQTSFRLFNSYLKPEPSKPTPFFAGFGNRHTDGISYQAVGIPVERIYLINPRGELHMEMTPSNNRLIGGDFSIKDSQNEVTINRHLNAQNHENFPNLEDDTKLKHWELSRNLSRTFIRPKSELNIVESADQVEESYSSKGEGAILQKSFDGRTSKEAFSSNLDRNKTNYPKSVDKLAVSASVDVHAGSGETKSRRHPSNSRDKRRPISQTIESLSSSVRHQQLSPFYQSSYASLVDMVDMVFPPLVDLGGVSGSHGSQHMGSGKEIHQIINLYSSRKKANLNEKSQTNSSVKSGAIVNRPQKEGPSNAGDSKSDSQDESKQAGEVTEYHQISHDFNDKKEDSDGPLDGDNEVLAPKIDQDDEGPMDEYSDSGSDDSDASTASQPSTTTSSNNFQREWWGEGNSEDDEDDESYSSSQSEIQETSSFWAQSSSSKAVHSSRRTLGLASDKATKLTHQGQRGDVNTESALISSSMNSSFNKPSSENSRKEYVYWSWLGAVELPSEVTSLTNTFHHSPPSTDQK